MPVDPRRMRPRKVPGAPPASTLPAHLAPLFTPNPALDFKPKITKRKLPPYTGIAHLVSEFEVTPPPPRVVEKTREDHAKAKKERKAAEHKAKQLAAIAAYKPKEQIEAGNAYSTLFVTGMSYATTPKTLKAEFESFGPVVSVRIVKDREGKSRGYGFIEFETEADMKVAYKRADGRKIDGRRVTVDVERGRTVRGWLPRRLGGGLGTGRPAKLSKEQLIVQQRLSGGYGGGGRFGGAPRPYVGGGPRFGGYGSSSRPGGYRGGGGGDRDRDRDRGRRDDHRRRSRDRGDSGRSRDRSRHGSRHGGDRRERRSSRSRSPHRRR